MTQWGLDNLFNPGKRHMDDEKRRLQSTREEVGDASGGRRIDLEAGKVSISVPGRSAVSTEGATDTAPESDIAPETPAEVDADALEPALEATAVPSLALASDAEIEPEIVVEAAPAAAPDVEPEVVDVVPEPVAVAAPDVAPAADPDSDPAPEPATAQEPATEPEPEPVAPPARRRTLSASAWSRRG